jgi:hypothetical protein
MTFGHYFGITRTIDSMKGFCLDLAFYDDQALQGALGYFSR